jgi:hypothetical protein
MASQWLSAVALGQVAKMKLSRQNYSERDEGANAGAIYVASLIYMGEISRSRNFVDDCTE